MEQKKSMKYWTDSWNRALSCPQYKNGIALEAANSDNMSNALS